MPKQTYTTAQLVLRSLTPSPVSFFLCLFFATFFVASDVILASVRYGTSLPWVFDGEWAVAYTTHVVQPLTLFFSNATFNKSFVAVFWGIIGLVGYVGFEFAIRTMRGLRQARHDVAIQQGQVLLHPMQRDANRAILWRTGVIVGFIVFVVIIHPLLNNAGSVAPQFVISQNLGTDSLRLLLSAFEWMILLHGLVVAIRLYTMRTRIFGDDKLY